MANNIYRVPTIYSDIKKTTEPLSVQVPGSKSITNRSLLLAMLAEGKSTLRGVLFSDDSRHFLKCVQDLGFETTVDEESCIVTVEGLGGKLPCEEAVLNVGSAGTAARFLTATLGVSEGVFHMDSSEQMKRRPMDPLLSSLAELGCEVRCEGEDGHFPFTLTAHGFGQDHISIDIGHSSQFLSALLIASTLSSEDFTIQVEGTHGMAYIEMTQKMMEQFGVCVERPTPDQFRIPAGQHYKALDYQIEPDVSAACYFYAMAALTGGRTVVKSVHKDSMQGDLRFLEVLEKLGCHVTDTEAGIEVTGTNDGHYPGITVDMNDFSDQTMTLAALAPFADSPTTIRNIGHIRLQESDRLSAIAKELTKMGIRVEEGEDFLVIYPGIPQPSLVSTYEDHRMAMAFSLIGLRSEGIVIDNPLCCKKTFEEYFTLLDQIIKEHR